MTLLAIVINRGVGFPKANQAGEGCGAGLVWRTGGDDRAAGEGGFSLVGRQTYMHELDLSCLGLVQTFGQNYISENAKAR